MVQHYQIRQARSDEIPRLRLIEDEAGKLFSGLGLIDESLDSSLAAAELQSLVAAGQVWVGCLDDGTAVGMVIASVREGCVHIEEMDVLPTHGRRGLGRRLLERACAWAQEHGYPAVTLSTSSPLTRSDPLPLRRSEPGVDHDAGVAPDHAMR